MRDIYEVVDEMLGVYDIPDSARIRLEWLKNDISYKAPEEVNLCWNRAADVVNEILQYPPKEEWEIAVAEIFTGENND